MKRWQKRTRLYNSCTNDKPKFWKGSKQPFLILAIRAFQFTITLLCDVQQFC